MQNPPPPPPPPSSQPPMVPPGQPPAMPPNYGGAMAAPAGNLASSGLRIVGGLIDVIIIGVFIGIVYGITRGDYRLGAGFGLIVTLAYLGYFWSSRGQSIGMMVFGFHVRDKATGQHPDLGKALLRAFLWWLEVYFTFCIIGAIGWLWQLWDPERQAIHDKVAGTIVTIN